MRPWDGARWVQDPFIPLRSVSAWVLLLPCPQLNPVLLPPLVGPAGGRGVLDTQAGFRPPLRGVWPLWKSGDKQSWDSRQ